ncbi:MAG: TonB-dependent receptor family protein [Chitinophagaceae bacterium]|nr:TonB-dependent receptor family protein [Chitinophagaceae bacterium]
MLRIFLAFILVGCLFPLTTHARLLTATISGMVKDAKSKAALAFVSVVCKKATDTTFVTGTVTSETGLFTMSNINSGNYILEVSRVGFETKAINIYVGSLSSFLDVATIELQENTTNLEAVTVTATQQGLSNKLDKKTFNVSDNISQAGGSVLQAMQNLPGITIQDGKIQLRGSDKVAILIDGKQTAITGFGSQAGLDNLPASAIEKIEIINNPSAKYDANGNAGIINIIYKKNKQQGFNGKAAFTTGLGALWVRKQNLPGIRSQYTTTPKINPSLTLNYLKNKVNTFLQADYLYTETLNKNEFTERTYTDGNVINQQLKRNRNTTFFTSKLGIDYNINSNDQLTISGYYGSEKIIDRGDEPFFNKELKERLRLWQFLEDELKTTVMATASYQHKYNQPGRVLNVGFNYTFHREDEKYFFDNIMPTFTGKDAFKLLSDEHVADFNLDYIRPLRYGRVETGFKFRRRTIPTNMQFFPGINSPIDANAGGEATYKETIPAVYGNYIYETIKMEAEIGLRVEYVNLNYQVNPNHNTYKSDGYNYMQPFPTVRLAYKINDQNKLSLFYNRRVDRPNEVDIRIFPKYDDAEIIKVGNPALKPQFTNTLELGYKANLSKGYFYSALYHRFANATITRISSTVPGSNLIYAIFQNVNRSYNSGIELLFSKEVSKAFSYNVNLNTYRNQVNGFTVLNLYPVRNTFTAETESLISGNFKVNATAHLKRKIDVQFSAVYLAKDIIPQGEIGARFSLDAGIKKSIQKNRGELFANATDLFNTLVIKKKIKGSNFNYTSSDYFETQVVRLGYSLKF